MYPIYMSGIMRNKWVVLQMFLGDISKTHTYMNHKSLQNSVEWIIFTHE